MKYLCMVNGWKSAPHCWKKHILKPFWIEGIIYGWMSVTIFGFVFFFDTPKWINERISK